MVCFERYGLAELWVSKGIFVSAWCTLKVKWYVIL